MTDVRTVRRCRQELFGWLSGLDVRADDVDAVLHAAGELVQNAVDHAYPAATAGPLRLAANLQIDGSVRVTVTDDGVWTTPDTAAGRGLGLTTSRALVNHVEVAGSPRGTTATIRHRLHRGVDAMSTASERTSSTVPSQITDVWGYDTGDGEFIGARGPLDATAAAELAAAIAVGTRRGGHPATLDLRDVTLLGSAAVRTVLQARRDSPDLRIVAPAGSTAHHVLTLAAIPVETGGAGPLFAPDDEPPSP